jgi:hypothetical protein
MQKSPLRQVVFAVVFEFAVFHTTPSTLSIIGALMIVSSAIYTTVIFPFCLLSPILSSRSSSLQSRRLPPSQRVVILQSGRPVTLWPQAVMAREHEDWLHYVFTLCTKLPFTSLVGVAGRHRIIGRRTDR